MSMSNPSSPASSLRGQSLFSSTEKKSEFLQATINNVNETIKSLADKRTNKELLSRLQTVLDTLKEFTYSLIEDNSQKDGIILHLENRLSAIVQESCVAAITTVIQTSRVPEEDVASAPTKKSYSSAVASFPEDAPPIVVIDAADSTMSAPNIRDSIRDLAVANKILTKPKKVQLTNRNRIVLTLDDRDTAEQLANKLQASAPNEKFKFIVPKIRRKRFITTNIPTSLPAEDFLQELQNLIPFTTDHLEIAYEYPDKNGLRNLSYEVDYKTAAYLLKLKRVCINYTSFSISPYVRIIRCQNCQDFGHFAHQCKKHQKCSNCSKDHDVKDCNSKTYNCPNCSSLPNNKRRPDHPANSSQCPCFLEYKRHLMEKARNWLDSS